MVNLSQVKEVILNNKNVEEIQKNGVTLWESPYLIITFNSSLTEYGTNGLIGNNIQYKVDDGEWINYDGKLNVTGSKLKIKRVTSIGDSCFRNCSGLTSISIPDSITSIGADCFYNCFSLRMITMLPTTPPALSSGSISVTPVTIYVPKGCRTAYMNAPNYPQDATYIELE